MHLAHCFLDTLALVGGTVHSMQPGEAPRVATVLITAGRITAVGDALSVPADARVLDARGLHLIPGLIDGFAYHDPDHDLLYTAAGVTLVRDHGNDVTQIFENREPAQRDPIPGPALSISGAVFDGVPPATEAALVVRNAAEARDALEHLHEEHIDFVAFQSHLGVDAWKALCGAAAEKQLQIWGPRLAATTLDEALAAGQSGFVFLDGLLPAGSSWDAAEIVDLEPAADRLSKAGRHLTPVMRGNARLLDGEPRVDSLACLSSQYEALWMAEAAQRQRLLDGDARRRIEVLLGKQRAMLLKLARSGAALVPGSGAPHPWLMPGEGLHRELVEWQGCGLPADEVLRLATAGAARALGLDAERGTLAPGKIADVVALRADPRVDLSALSEVELVVVRGRALSRAELDRGLAALVARQGEARGAARRAIQVDAPELPEGQVLLSGRVETNSAVGALAAERWAVVREVDGTLTFCGKRALRVGRGLPDTVLEVRQRVRDKRFDSFEVRSRSGEHEMRVRGFVNAEQWRIERRLDGQFLDNRAAVDALAAIDAGSVTTMLLLAHTRSAGHFPVLRFDEGLEVEVVRWDLALDDDGDHAFRTPQGLKFAGFMENGALKLVVEQKGQASLETMSVELDLHGGAGLPLADAKLTLMRKAAAGPVTDK